MIASVLPAVALLTVMFQEGAENAHISPQWVWCEEGYLVNSSWIRYIDTCWGPNSYSVKVHLAGGNSCVLKYGFKTKEEAEKWIKGER